MELTPDMLDAYLKLLKEHGVAEFLGQGFHVRFAPEIPEEVILPKTEEPKKQRSMWEDESLWPGGQPPAFQRKGP